MISTSSKIKGNNIKMATIIAGSYFKEYVAQILTYIIINIYLPHPKLMEIT